MKKSIVIFAVLLICTILGAAAITNYHLMNSSQIPTKKSAPNQTNQPTSNPTASTTITPKPSILKVISPTNATYSTNSVELTYTIDSKVVWSYYGLDTSGNGAGSSEYAGINELFTLHGLVPFKGNITLNLPIGQHTLLLAIQTEQSRFSSVPIAYQTIDFTIDTTINPP